MGIELLATWLRVFCVFGIVNELTLSCPLLEEDKTQECNSIQLNLFILLLVSSYCLRLTRSDLLCDVGAVGYWMVLSWLKTLSQEAKHRMTPLTFVLFLNFTMTEHVLSVVFSSQGFHKPLTIVHPCRLIARERSNRCKW